MVLVALFSYLLGAYLTRGLQELRAASRSISSGALGTRVEIKGRDELAETGWAFNDMSLRLAESQREMEQAIAAFATRLAAVGSRLILLSVFLFGMTIFTDLSWLRLMDRTGALAIRAALPALKQNPTPAAAVLFSSVAARQGFTFHASIGPPKRRWTQPSTRSRARIASRPSRWVTCKASKASPACSTL